MFSSSGALTACCVGPHNDCLVNHNALHLNTHRRTCTHKVHIAVEKDFTASLTYKLPPASTMMKISAGLCSDPGELVLLPFHPSSSFFSFSLPRVCSDFISFISHHVSTSIICSLSLYSNHCFFGCSSNTLRAETSLYHYVQLQVTPKV